jgi:ATP-dependent protease ClpP protease subunit
MPERATVLNRSEESAEAIVAANTGRRAEGVAVVIEDGMSQMFAKAKLAGLVDRVNDKPRQRETGFAELSLRNLRHRVGESQIR